MRLHYVLDGFELALHFSDRMYSAKSAISARFSDRLGMFGCGMRSRKASLFWSNSGAFPIDANGGAWSVVLV